jgi:hypothetical protein
MAAPDLNATIERDDVQGLLASGYGHLHEGRFLLLAIDERRGRVRGSAASQAS